MDPRESLCNKDPRNPMFNDLYGVDEETPVPRGGCSCDNCFYGRDALSLEIIRLRQSLESRVYQWLLSEGLTLTHYSPEALQSAISRAVNPE